MKYMEKLGWRIIMQETASIPEWMRRIRKYHGAKIVKKQSKRAKNHAS